MKTFKTYEEQLDYLEKNKRITHNLDNELILQERNYSSLITPYKEIFSSGRDASNKHIYNYDTSLSDLIRMAQSGNSCKDLTL